MSRSHNRLTARADFDSGSLRKEENAKNAFPGEKQKQKLFNLMIQLVEHIDMFGLNGLKRLLRPSNLFRLYTSNVSIFCFNRFQTKKKRKKMFQSERLSNE